MNTLQIGPTVRFGWETFKKRPWFFLGSLLFINILSNASVNAEDLGWDDLTPGMVAAFFLVSIALFIVNVIAKMGANAFLLKAHENPEGVRFNDLWAPKPFWRFVFATLLKGLVISGPLLLVIGGAYAAGPSLMWIFMLLGIPAVLWLIYAAVRLAFVEMIVMDKQMMPVEAQWESVRITEGSFWQLVLLMLALLGIVILGLLALVVGLLVALPIVMFAFVHAYRTLEHAASEIVPAGPPSPSAQ